MFLQIFLGIMFPLLGLLLGSFSNVIIYRLSENIPFNNPKRSFCPTCKNPIKWYDNIPIVSYIILGGKCRHCKEPISIRYPMVEAIGLFIGLACYFVNYMSPDLSSFQTGFTFVFNYKSVIYLIIGLILLNASGIDMRIYEIPYRLMIPLILCFVAIYVGDCIIAKDYLLYNLIGLGAVVVLFGLMYFIFAFFFKKEVMGMGDIIIMAFAGLAFNVINFILILLVSSVLACIIEIIKMLVFKEKKQIPFVPYLASGIMFVMFFGNALTAPILRSFGS